MMHAPSSLASFSFALAALLLLPHAAPPLAGAAEPVRLSSPAGDRPCIRNRDGVTILPNGRLVTPAGHSVIVPPFPFGLALSPNGRVLAAVSGSDDPNAITLLTDLESDTPYVRQAPSSAVTEDDVLPAAFMGAAFSPDSGALYVSGGNEGTIRVFDVTRGSLVARIDLNGPVAGSTEGEPQTFRDSFIGEIALSPDGATLYAVDQANFRLVVVDPKETSAEDAAAGRTGRVIGSVPVGRYPFDVELSRDGRTAYVANVGMFAYSTVKGITALNPDAWLKFPAFAYDSAEMREGTKIGGIDVPGLGDPNAPESFSIWRVDVSARGAETVTGKVKTGVRVGEMVEGVPAVGGSCPSSLVVGDDGFLYVGNGSNDTISVIDAATFEISHTIPLALGAPLEGLRGQIPFGLTLSPDGARLYVAEAGINAVAVVDVAKRAVIGRIPTAWFPARVAATHDGRGLFVACGKGFGAGPNGGLGFVAPPGGAGIGYLMKGAVTRVDLPDDAGLAEMTKRVMENLVKVEPVPASEIGGAGGETGSNAVGRNPVPPYPGAFESPIKHVIYITKENRTYDQVFGEYEAGRGDPTIADLGMRARCTGRDQPALEDVNVSPNHQALARRYAISDNFYCDSDHSNDGHRWLVGTFPNVWTETATKTGPRQERLWSPAPGRRLMTGSSGAIYPEDYNEAGSIWEHLHRNGIEFYNFGLGFEFAGSQENDYPDTGIRIAVNYPLPAPLFHRTSRNFPTYNMNVPDQIRVNHFEAELEEKWLSGKEPFPPLITMMLPNDHGAGENADRGYPYRQSYMADNDLALGRVIETLSKTPWWNEMAIFVTEDDAQGGLDHIDHHRSILMVLGPWAKRGYVSRRHVSFGSILKTIHLILGAPYLNQYDAAASDLSDCFNPAPDPERYAARAVDPRLFDPDKAAAVYDEKVAWEPGPALDDPDFVREEREGIEEGLRER